jgi:hypothetical protein
MRPSSGIVNTDLYADEVRKICTSDESLPRLLFTFYSFSTVRAVVFHCIYLDRVQIAMDIWGLCRFSVASLSCLVVAAQIETGYQDGISYMGLFLAERFVAFSEISTVVFINYKHAGSLASLQRTTLSWTAIVTPNIETGEAVVKITSSLFPGAASREMTRLLHPEVWESGS